MTFWPDGFDPRGETAQVLQLADIDAPSGLARFLIGQDGRFVDTLGQTWWGAQLVEAGPVEISRGTRAPEGSVTLTWFQDPEAPDLIAQLRATGDDALAGARVRFFLQPVRSAEEFYSPAFPPVLLATRWCAGVTFELPDALTRRIVVRLESSWADRRRVPGVLFRPEDYQTFLGNPDPRNPSLDLMPINATPENSLVT